MLDESASPPLAVFSDAGGVGVERDSAGGRVGGAGGVVARARRQPLAVLSEPVVLELERASAAGRVVGAGGVGVERVGSRWPCCRSR